MDTQTKSKLTNAQPFREEHRRIEEQLARLEQMANAISTVMASERPKLFDRIADGLKRYLVPHAQWEESEFYPLVDKLAGSHERPFTETMRFEHRIIERWTRGLAELAALPHPDPDLFQNKAQQLFGLIRAHFELEEELLLPVVEEGRAK